MDTPNPKIAIVIETEGGHEIQSITEMSVQRFTELIQELEATKAENEQLKQIKAYHENVTMNNNADLRIVLDSLNRTGILRQNEIHISAFLKNHVRKIIDEYDYERNILGRIEAATEEWKNVGIAFFKNIFVNIILKRFTKK